MKKRGNILLTFILFGLLINLVSAVCNIDISLLNQDPYPAIPGDSVKIVFQIEGIADPSCGQVKFEVKENYPFTIDKESTNPITINSGSYSKGYSSFYLAPYKLRVDKEAMNGETPIEVTYSYSGSATLTREMDISIENTYAEFEIAVKDYNYLTKELTLEVLNYADVDIKALTIEIPKQNNIQITGTNRVIVGDLDSNEYTSADFNAELQNGEFEVIFKYTDSAGIRRETTQKLNFDSSYFSYTNKNNKSNSSWIFIVLLIVGVVGFFIYKKKKKNSKK